MSSGLAPLWATAQLVLCFTGISVVQDKQLHMRAATGIPEDFSCARDGAFCSWTLLPKKPEVLIIEDTLKDARSRPCQVQSQAFKMWDSILSTGLCRVNPCTVTAEISSVDHLSVLWHCFLRASSFAGSRHWIMCRAPTDFAFMPEHPLWLQTVPALGLCENFNQIADQSMCF